MYLLLPLLEGKGRTLPGDQGHGAFIALFF